MSENPFRYLPVTEKDMKDMLKAIGKPSLESLFGDIPADVRLNKELKVPNPHSEYEVLKHLKETTKDANTNLTTFLGGGIYNGFIPSVLPELISRSEFYSSYTPYAPEISQGMLQTLWEYQSFICELTDLGASNSSMYDWGTAIAESVLMCRRLARRKKTFLLPEIICQNRLSTIKTYIDGMDIELRFIPYDRNTGQLDHVALDDELAKGDVCGVYLETPNFFGVVEKNVQDIAKKIHDKKARFVIGYQPLSLGILESPGKLGADIAVGEGQQLGIAPTFGGPLLGLFTCKADRRIIRSMPGRVIGYSTTKEGDEDAFIMTLQTREQHIRREKATSNICSNQALLAVNAAIYMALMGTEGFKDIGKTLIAKSTYLMEHLSSIKGITIPFEKEGHFREFVIQLPIPAKKFLAKMREKEILAGIDLSRGFKDLENAILVNVLETHSKEDLDKFVDATEEILEVV